MTRDYLVEIVVKLLSLQVWLWLWLHPFRDDEHWAWLSEGFPAVYLPRQSPQIDQQDHDPMAGLLRTQVRVSVGRRTEFQNCVCLLLTWFLEVLLYQFLIYEMQECRSHQPWQTKIHISSVLVCTITCIRSAHVLIPRELATAPRFIVLV